MKHLIIAAVILLVLVEAVGMLWSPKGTAPDGTFAKLSEPPRRFIDNPYHNGYFYLFGLTASPPLDPTRVGYEIWVEESEESRRAGLDEHGTSRDDLRLTIPPQLTAMAWEADEPLNEFQKNDTVLHEAIAHQQTLLARYERWLELPFEDWGFGHRVTPRYQDIMSTHRFYVVEGFSLGTLQGLERLRKELQFWRLVLREAKTIRTKVLAQVVMTDDLNFLSRILAKPTVDPAILTMGLQMTLPLSESEYSLRWPIRNQLALVVKETPAGGVRNGSQTQRDRDQDEWLLREGKLPLDAFDSIEHPPSQAMLGVTLQSGQAWNTYAAYYNAIITASESKARSLPGMREVTGTLQRGLIEKLVNPHLNEPDWAIFHRKSMETDTRLRLASLQIQLRRPSAQTAVPTRLAEVGSQYFDPFTGLPMLWSPTQHKLYSVGRDRLDDGGDPTFDISVPTIVATTQASEKDPIHASPLPRSTHPKKTRSRHL